MSVAEAERRQRKEITERRRHLGWIQAARCAREIMGITQQQAADQLGVHIDTFRGWEAGRYQPRPPQAKDFKRWMVEILIAYASIDYAADLDKDFIGSSVFRQRLGLAGHCARCANLGDHRLAHPKLACNIVGCYSKHPNSPEDEE